jgi:hypothetical protein
MLESNTMIRDESELQVRGIGMVVYTYETLEARSHTLLKWVDDVSDWLRKPIDELHFDPREKTSNKIWKLTSKNTQKLRSRIEAEKPWSNIHFGWGIGTLRYTIAQTKGAMVLIKSRPKPDKGNEKYRNPSFVYLEFHPDAIQLSESHIKGLIALGSQLWDVIDGCYGFIDIEIDRGLHDDVSRNALHLLDNSVDKQLEREFLKWKNISSDLDKKAWRIFWGNFFGRSHIEQIKDFDGEPLKGVVNQVNLNNDGQLLILPNNPTLFFSAQTQEARKKLYDYMRNILVSNL